MEGSITQLGLGNYLINKKEKAKSFFKHSYQNYQNFVKDTRRLTFKGNNNFGDTMQMRLDQEANYGDLITNLVLEIDLPDISSVITTTGKSIGYCNGVGNALIDYVEIKMGGTTIDRQTREWMDIWSSLSVPSGKQSNYKRMIKKFNNDEYTLCFNCGELFVDYYGHGDCQRCLKLARTDCDVLYDKNRTLYQKEILTLLSENKITEKEVIEKVDKYMEDELFKNAFINKNKVTFHHWLYAINVGACTCMSLYDNCIIKVLKEFKISVPKCKDTIISNLIEHIS